LRAQSCHHFDDVEDAAMTATRMMTTSGTMMMMMTM
jgi:hypothetical protein